jgi:hypothetical protein
MISPTSLGAAATLASAALEAAESAGKAASKGSAKSTGGVASVLLQAAPALAKAVIAGLAKPKSSRTSAKARTGRSGGAGYAKSTSKTTTSRTGSTSKASDPLAFLKDPNLSIEEKLMRLLAHLNEKWEKDMQKKMEEIAGKSSAKSSSSKKAGGLLGSIGSVLKGALPQMGILVDALKSPVVRGFLSKISGPVLAAGATAAGFPQLAPVLLKYGPKAVEVAAGLASSLEDSAGGSSTSSAKASTAGETGKTEQLQLMELQRMFDKQKEMFSLVSNILKAGHDTRMSVINNVR